MKDFTIDRWFFGDTDTFVECNTEAAREMLGGAISFSITVNGIAELESECDRRGLTYEIRASAEVIA